MKTVQFNRIHIQLVPALSHHQGCEFQWFCSFTFWQHFRSGITQLQSWYETSDWCWSRTTLKKSVFLFCFFFRIFEWTWRKTQFVFRLDPWPELVIHGSRNCISYCSFLFVFVLKSLWFCNLRRPEYQTEQMLQFVPLFSSEHQYWNSSLTWYSIACLHYIDLNGSTVNPTRGYISSWTSLYGVLWYSLTFGLWVSILASIMAKLDLQFPAACGEERVPQEPALPSNQASAGASLLSSNGWIHGCRQCDNTILLGVVSSL